MKINQVITEKSVSQQQQKFMGMVYAAKKGEKPASPAVAKTAAGMSKSDAKDFAKTKHKGLPNKVGEATGDPLGTVSAAPDASGKIKIKTPTGTEIETTKDALLPGAKPGTVQMKPDAAGDALKPGTQVVSAEAMGTKEDDGDTNDAIRAWNDKYSKYNGTNGPDLVNGWIDGMTSSGIISDGWEENEVYKVEQRLGKEMDEWEPEDYDYVSDNEDTLLPISTAMVEELASILGVDAVGEEEANQVANILYGSTDESTGELDRIKELSGLKGEDISFNGVTQHANGDMSYNQGPLSMRQNKDGSSDMTANIGNTTARVQQNPIGVKTLTAQGPEADSINSVDASADRKGVDPKKFASFRKQNPAAVKESPELIAMLSIAGLR